MLKAKEQVVLELIRKLIKNTKFEGKCFVAGGYVRDLVMGKQSKDIDITVELVNGGIELAEFLTKKTNCYVENSNPVIYQQFGTAKFNFRNKKYQNISISDVDIETVMTRQEQYKNNSRKPDVVFGTKEKDVERRDLTINSLLYDISNDKILDLTGTGISDIKNKIIRTPMDANIIFKEDPLRMMRAIRFAVKFGWKLTDDMIKSIKANSDMLPNISSERINDELVKILMSDHPDLGVKFLMRTNLMKYIIPELYESVGVKQNAYHQFDVLNHILLVLKNSPKKIEIRLAALFHDIAKPSVATKKDDGEVTFKGHDSKSAEIANNSLRKLKFSNDVIDKVVKLVDQHMRTKTMGDDLSGVSDKVFRKLMRDLGNDLEDLLDLIHADNISHGDSGWKHNMPNQVKNIREKIKTLGDFTQKLNLPVDGNRVMKLLNISPGKDVGIILRNFEDMFLSDPDAINNMSDSEIDDLVKTLYHNITNESTLLKHIIGKMRTLYD